MTKSAPHAAIHYHSKLKLADANPNARVGWAIKPPPQYTGPKGSVGGMPWFHAGDTLDFNVVDVPEGTAATLTFRKIKGGTSALPTPFAELNNVKVHDGVYPYVTGQRLTFETDKSPVIQPIEYDWGFTLFCNDAHGNEHRFDPELQVGAGGPQKN